MKTILVAVDSSPVASVVFQKAQEMAEAIGAKIILFQAVSLPIEMPPEIYAKPQEQLPALLIREVKEELEQLRSSQTGNAPVDIRVEIGVPWQSICDTASKEKVDMIVIGSHGYHWYERMLGSTATRVVNHAAQPVLIVRGGKQSSGANT